MGKQTFIVHLEEALAGEILDFLRKSGRGYADLNDFVQVALVNQLNAEGATLLPHTKDEPSQPNFLLAQPSEEKVPDLIDEPMPSDDTLFVLTNRFGPIKAAVRVLSNLMVSNEREWPWLQDFREQAAIAARGLGQRLRAEDEVQGLKANNRRSVGFPVGKSERAALDRFIFSFTIDRSASGQAVGPLATLGLANLAGEHVALTHAGWALALAPSPLLDGVAGKRLSDDEAEILLERLMRSPGEYRAVMEFVDAVVKGHGTQDLVDETLAALHPEWSRDLVLAHRAALLGRLGDLQLIGVDGRGPGARINLTEAARQLWAAQVRQKEAGQ